MGIGPNQHIYAEYYLLVEKDSEYHTARIKTDTPFTDTEIRSAVLRFMSEHMQESTHANYQVLIKIKTTEERKGASGTVAVDMIH